MRTAEEDYPIIAATAARPRHQEPELTAECERALAEMNDARRRLSIDSVIARTWWSADAPQHQFASDQVYEWRGLPGQAEHVESFRTVCLLIDGKVRLDVLDEFGQWSGTTTMRAADFIAAVEQGWLVLVPVETEHAPTIVAAGDGFYLNVGCVCGWRCPFPFTGRDDEAGLRQQAYDVHVTGGGQVKPKAATCGHCGNELGPKPANFKCPVCAP